MCNSGGSVRCICISKESQTDFMKLRKQLLTCGFGGDERRLQALIEWLHGEDVLCLGHLVGAPPVNEIRGANAFQEDDIKLLKKVFVSMKAVAFRSGAHSVRRQSIERKQVWN